VAPAAEERSPASSGSPALGRPSDSTADSSNSPAESDAPAESGASTDAPARSDASNAAPQSESTSTGNQRTTRASSADVAPGSSSAAGQFEARRSGATEGVTTSGGQPVFTGSVAKDAAADVSGDGADAGASPAATSATGNLWSGFAPDQSSSLSAADASAAPQSGDGGSQTIGMAILGLGLTGLLGGFLVAAVRRQRVQVGRRNGRNEL